MSAYGTIAAPASASNEPLKQLLYRLPDETRTLLVVPFKREAVPEPLADHLHTLFNDIVAEGRTYPQEEGLSLQSFKVSVSSSFIHAEDAEELWQDYYLAYDLFIGLLIPSSVLQAQETVSELAPDTFASISGSLTSLEWQDIVAGCYYVKPNYPGRSSHCCNGGFVVDPKHRGLQIGRTLGRSYLYYAPKLGYKYSVFNLVYVNNIASVKIWDSLGFQRAGLVPKVGRLKTADGKGEEYVDAYLYWRDLSLPVL